MTTPWKIVADGDSGPALVADDDLVIGHLVHADDEYARTILAAPALLAFMCEVAGCDGARWGYDITEMRREAKELLARCGVLG